MKKFIEAIPLIILICICINTAVNLILEHTDLSGETFQYVITEKHYGAFISVFITLIMFFSYRPVYKYFLFLTIALGLFNIINFTISYVQFEAGFSWLSFKWQPTSFYVGIVAILVYGRSILNLMNYRPEQKVSSIVKDYEVDNYEQMEKFRKIYKNKSTDELVKISIDSRFTTVAKTVADQIISERENKTE